MEVEVALADAGSCACESAGRIDTKGDGVACFVGAGAGARQAAHAVGVVGQQAFPAVVGALCVVVAGFADPALCGRSVGRRFGGGFGPRFGCGFRRSFGGDGFGCGFRRSFGGDGFGCGFRRSFGGDGFGGGFRRSFGGDFGGGFGEGVTFGAAVLLGDHDDLFEAASAAGRASTRREREAKA